MTFFPICETVTRPGGTLAAREHCLTLFPPDVNIAVVRLTSSLPLARIAFVNSRSMPRPLIHLVIAVATLLFLLIIGGRLQPQQASVEAGAAPQLDVQFSPPPGPYNETIAVEMWVPDGNATIYFTMDGSRPSRQNGTLYTDPLVLSPRPSQVVALRAMAVSPEGEEGTVQSVSYLLGVDSALPVLSLVVDPQELWDAERGIFTHPVLTGDEWERPAEMAFYEADGSAGFAAPVGIRVHGGRSRLDEKKSLRLYFRNEYGLPAIGYPLFPQSDKRLFKRLVLHNGGQDYPAVSVNATLLRNQLTGDLAREAGGFAVQTRPVLVFLNGELWGIYNLRERIDDRYLAENMQIENPDLLVGFEHDLEASYGDVEHWENLQRFVAENELDDPENYLYLQTQINLDNFIDYNLFQIITANADWPHSNQLKFRERAGGQWHWMFWDSDYAFGLMPDSYIEKDMFARVLEQEDELQQEAALLLEKLLRNPDFRNRFFVRLADLLNTVFRPQKVEKQVLEMAKGLRPDIVYETIRWPGSGDWEAGVSYMQEFARRRPDIVRKQAVEQFDLPGTAVLTIGTPTAGQGSVRVNDQIMVDASELPWSGTYFDGLTLKVEALPAPGYVFAGWDGAEGVEQTAAASLALEGDLLISPRFAEADSNMPRPGDVRLLDYGGSHAAAPLAGIEGRWVTLEVRKPTGSDLRGWRVSDNDSITAVDEGSLVLTDAAELAQVAAGTIVLLAPDSSTDANLPPGWIIATPMNGLLDVQTDPWFQLAEHDNLVLLAPGPVPGFGDDVPIDFLEVGGGEVGDGAAAFGLPDRLRFANEDGAKGQGTIR